ncbi:MULTISPECIES: cysteine hydrolase family protein [unclassified Fusibacter]|uniref:cysteine hydrolase family protein n=1 Tax=unclassified Fusibacter TaxID=2624464 RepID=UPI001010C63A|nr:MULTISPECIES: isochorismatase family protein [unclassified Fusibacter]MCK8060142.1 isochorismatase family protein [Fusibacter sp. A2]NPE22284.1 isochorismatase family protein [Fusibacter sp. A1]RXV61057.1 isochorismatase family protein [Fusibacter sp. A1]
MKIGLLVIDLQKAWYDEHSKASMDMACNYINGIIPLFKSKNLPVIYIKHIAEGRGVLPGSNGFEMLDQLIPDEEDPIIHKTYGNAFNKTNLKELVDESGVDTWVLAGYRAENCILSTYRGALDLDLTPVLLKNAVAGPIKENVEFVESISESITYGILTKLLE